MYFNIKNKIFIHKLFLILPIIPFFGVSVKFYFYTLCCAFIHESAHLAASLLKKVKINHLFVTPYGFELRISPPPKYHEYFIVSGGPLASLTLSLLFFLFENPALAKINFTLFAINIIPAIPLDGGRFLKVFLWDRYGAGNGNIILKHISTACGIILVFTAVLTFNVWLLFISILIFTRSCSLAASPFFRKRMPSVVLRFYCFEKDTSLSVLLNFISPYNYLAIIVPGKNKVFFEWELLEKIENCGFGLTLRDV